MQIDYKGEHSITFYDYRNANMTSTPPDIPVYNTWSSWFLIPTTAPYFKPYEPKLNIVSIPGSNGVVDLSEAVVGKVLGDRRVGEWEFIMDIERAIKSNTINVNSPWDLYYKIISDIDRKWVVCVLLDSPGHIFTGRITVTGFTVESGYGKIKLSYNVGGRNTAWLSTGKNVDDQDVAKFIKENISDNWTPETFDDQGNGMIEENLDHLISENQFQVEWTVPDGPMYEIEVDDDGTLIQEDTVPVISYEDEIVFDDEAEWDPETSPFQMYVVRYLNDDGSVLGEPESVIFGTVINPSTDYQGTPVSQIESTAQFVGWSESDGLIINSDTDIYARYDYDLIYYKVRFYNDDDSYLAEIFVRPGETAVYPSQTLPISAIHGSSFSIFKEWSKKLENVLSDMDVTAVYETVVRVRFYNDDGNPILVNGNYVDAIVPYGTSVAYPYDDPVSSYASQYDDFQSTFTGWDKSLSNLTPTKDELDNDGFYRVQAQYDYGSTFKVNFLFVRDLGEYLQELTIDTKIVQPGGMVSATSINVRSPAALYNSPDGYRFLGWNENKYSETPISMPTVIIKDTNLYPIFSYTSIEEQWETVFESESDGSYLTKYHIGDHMPLKSNTGYTAWVMEIAAIDTDILSNNTGNAKITWICNTIWQPVRMNASYTNSGGWKDSELRAVLNEEVLPLYLPDYIQSNIKEVKKTFYDYGTNSTLVVDDKIWIPSARELGRYPNIGLYNENSGVQYNLSYSPESGGEVNYPNTTRKRYYPDGVSAGSISGYWLRSASPNDSSTFRYVKSRDGLYSGSYALAHFPMGLVFGFCT